MFTVQFIGGPLNGHELTTATQPAPGFWMGTAHFGKKQLALYRITHQDGSVLLAEADDQVTATV
jgi:hypothetical protein